MPATEDVSTAKKWLSRTLEALDDACSDARYAANTGHLVYLSFDPSVIFPPLALRGRLDINKPADWLDISAAAVFNNLPLYKRDVLGYQYVLSFPTFITIKRNYEMDIDLINQLAAARTDDDIYEIIRKQLPPVLRFGANEEVNSTAPTTPREFDEYLTAFLTTARKRHEKLGMLRDYIRNGIITTQRAILSDDILHRSAVSRKEFEELRRRIDQYRTISDGSIGSNERFVQGIEAMEILSNKHIADLFSGRYLFLGWPKSRGYYSDPRRYHRIITSVFFKLTSLIETPSSDDLIRGANSHLFDLRDSVQFLFRNVLAKEKQRQPLTPIMVRAISSLRNDYVKHLSGDIQMMRDDERRQLIKGFTGKKHEVREALVQARSQAEEMSQTLSELAAEFRQDEGASGWEPLDADNPIRQFIDRAKPAS